jgi:hypothetical protein
LNQRGFICVFCGKRNSPSISSQISRATTQAAMALTGNSSAGVSVRGQNYQSIAALLHTGGFVRSSQPNSQLPSLHRSHSREIRKGGGDVAGGSGGGATGAGAAAAASVRFTPNGVVAGGPSRPVNHNCSNGQSAPSPSAAPQQLWWRSLFRQRRKRVDPVVVNVDHVDPSNSNMGNIGPSYWSVWSPFSAGPRTNLGGANETNSTGGWFRFFS